MQLNDNTLKVLENFSTIQDNLVVKEGNSLLTMSEPRNLLASAKLDQKFPQEFGIYNLGEFIKTLSLVDNPTLKFSSKYMTITDDVGRSKVKYFFSDPSILTAPPGEPKLEDDDIDVTFTVDEQTLAHIRRASSVLGHDKMVLTPSGGNVLVSILDPKDKTTNSYAVEIPGDVGDHDFSFVIDITLLKMIAGNYEVSISRKLLSKFVNTTSDATYFVALEKSSTFNE